MCMGRECEPHPAHLWAHLLAAAMCRKFLDGSGEERRFTLERDGGTKAKADHEGKEHQVELQHVCDWVLHTSPRLGRWNAMVRCGACAIPPARQTRRLAKTPRVMCFMRFRGAFVAFGLHFFPYDFLINKIKCRLQPAVSAGTIFGWLAFRRMGRRGTGSEKTADNTICGWLKLSPRLPPAVTCVGNQVPGWLPAGGDVRSC